MVSEIVSDMKSRVLAGQIVGAHVVDVNSVPVTFIHGGLRPGMLENLDERIDKERQGSPKATTPRERSERIGAYINELTKEVRNSPPRPLDPRHLDLVMPAKSDFLSSWLRHTELSSY